MKESIVARRYARGMMLLARESNQLDRLEQDATRLTKAIAAVPALMKGLQDERVETGHRVAVIRGIAEVLGLSVYTRDAALLLLRRNRIHLLPQVAHEVVAMIMHERRLAVAQAEVATDGDILEVQEKIERILMQHFSVEVRCQVEVKPELLGGFAVTIGDNRFDGTIAGRVERLREEVMSEDGS